MAEDQSQEQNDRKQEAKSSWFKHIHFSDVILLIEILLGWKAILSDEVADDLQRHAGRGRAFDRRRAVFIH